MSSTAPIKSAALVVGGSSGIGLACVHRLSKLGNYQIYSASRRASESTLQGVSHLSLDVTCADSVTSAVNQVLAECGKIDVLINCAGYSLAGPTEETSISEAQDQFETNFWGVVRVNNAVLPSMRCAGAGKIVTIGSLGGLLPLPYQGFYSASKSALEAYCEALRFEVQTFGIDVILIEPGDLKTSFTANRKIAQQCSSESPYWKSFKRCLDNAIQLEASGSSADQVADKVIKLLGRKKPNLRHRITQAPEEAALWLRWLGISKLYERVIRIAFKL